MATFKAYPNGATMGTGNSNPVGGKRGLVTGWSTAAVRRHKRWLYSVPAWELDGYGDAVTLTLRDLPPTPECWQLVLRSLTQWFRDNRMVRWHWVVEWQARGVPHLHLACYGTAANPGRQVIAAWLRIAAEYRPAKAAQFVTPITGPVGWLKYLSKHASRGVRHYQRCGMPPGWTRTGRLWGYGGSWPAVEPVAGVLTAQQMWRVRRYVRAYVVADARSRGDWRAVAYLRRMLKCPDRALSSVRGVSEWVPGPVFLELALAAGWTGEAA